jgi:flavin reductase (DIM6/NTAB) family NADH-FMN oxidoreductase RutF
MGRLYYRVDELLHRPVLPGITDKTQIYYHFRPARPANLVVTRDPASGDLNVSAGTYGVLTESPLTLGLHISKHSFDTARNIQGVGTECVVALPTRDQVRETWYTALPIPRGISEAEVANLTLLPSRAVSVPGIAECPVNLECRVELVKDWRSHWVVFLLVVGASIDEEMIKGERLDIIRHYPTYEVDDQLNQFGGSIERLGVNGELLACPGFPTGAKRGPAAPVEEWIADLQNEHLISAPEAEVIQGWLGSWRVAAARGDQQRTDELRAPLARTLELAAWEDWAALHEHVAAAAHGQGREI